MVIIQLLLTGTTLAEDCFVSPAADFISLEYGKIQQENLQKNADVALSAQNIQFNALRRLSAFSSSGSDVFAGVAYEYRPVDVDTINASPQTNGYLHTLQLPLQWQIQNNRNEQYFNATLAIATSSNGFQHPDELQYENLQLRLGWAKLTEISERSDWLIGVCVNHLFGEYQAYPIVGWQTRMGDNIHLRLAVPHSTLQWRSRRHMLVNLELGPGGREWYIFNKDFTHESEFIWRAWEFNVNFQWSVADGWDVAFTAGYRFAQELEFELQNGGKLIDDLNNNSMFSLILTKQW